LKERWVDLLTTIVGVREKNGKSYSQGVAIDEVVGPPKESGRGQKDTLKGGHRATLGEGQGRGRRDEGVMFVADRWEDRPLLLKLSVNLTAFSTMIEVPKYWSFDPKRNLNH
jgi:hypothetical protein